MKQRMLGFSTEDVHDIFNYYKSTGEVRPDCDVDAVVNEMKPWAASSSWTFRIIMCANSITASCVMSIKR